MLVVPAAECLRDHSRIVAGRVQIVCLEPAGNGHLARRDIKSPKRDALSALTVEVQGSTELAGYPVGILDEHAIVPIAARIDCYGACSVVEFPPGQEIRILTPRANRKGKQYC
jgi:hypothetical protein